MAKRVITQLLDDLDGGDAEETVTFAMDGFAYSIDLSAKNAATFRELMATYQDAGTRLGRETHGSPAQLRSITRSTTNNREENTRIRLWANDNGYEVSERGRIPQHVVDAYRTGTPAISEATVQAAEEAAKKVEQEVKASPAKRASRAKAAPAAFSGES